MQASSRDDMVQKLSTGINGFDLISRGGLPLGRTTLVAGTSGSAKTVFACQFLAEGIQQAGENGVFISFEESPDDIRKNMDGFGWDIAAWEQDGRWAFVDASPSVNEETVMTYDYDFSALMARIEHAVRKTGALRVAMDSLGAIFNQFEDGRTVRQELFRIASALKKLNVTAVLTAERTAEYDTVTRFGVEEFVSDNVILLRNVLEEEKRRRTIEILKFRGTVHQKGEYPFTIMPGKGIIIIPLSAIELTQESTDIRVTSGNAELDGMCSGGFFRDSIILVSGATGTGKTLMVTEFLKGGVESGDKCLLLAFEESREQLFRNATGWGVDFARMEHDGMLHVECIYPETCGFEDHSIKIKDTIERFEPRRVAIDSLSALERIGSMKGFREFVISLTSYIKQKTITGLFTSTTPTLMGGTSVSEANISTITDSIIMLRYVEVYGEMRRGITVLKMRGSQHNKEITEFTIDASGMHIGKPFRHITGILSGNPVHVPSGEMEMIDSLFK